MEKKELNTVLWCLLIFTGCIFLLKISGYLMIYHVPLDFRTYYYVALGMEQRVNIYDYKVLQSLAQTMGDTQYVYPYLYPPPAAFLLMPMAKLSLIPASIIWQIVSLALSIVILCYGVHLASSFQASPTVQVLTFLMIAALAFLIILPFDNNLKIGQANVFVLIFILFSLIQALHGKSDFVAGCLLAPAVVIKITPVVLLLYYWLSGRRKAVWGFLSVATTLILPTLFCHGAWAQWRNFFHSLKQTAYGGTVPGLFPAAELANFSVAGWCARLVADELIVSIISWTVLIIGFSGLLLEHARTKDKDAPGRLLLAYLTLMVIASPLAYLHHVIYIFPGLMVITALCLVQFRRHSWYFLSISFAATTVAATDWPYFYRHLRLTSPMITSLNLYALLALFFTSLIFNRTFDGKDANKEGTMTG